MSSASDLGKLLASIRFCCSICVKSCHSQVIWKLVPTPFIWFSLVPKLEEKMSFLIYPYHVIHHSIGIYYIALFFDLLLVLELAI